MLDYHKVRGMRIDPVRHVYAQRDTMMYAMGVGLGTNPVDPAELRYVYEKSLVTFPTMASVIGSAGFFMQRPETGVDATRLLHGEQNILVHRPIPASGTVIGYTTITRVVDKPSLGALVYVERRIHDAAENSLLATIESMFICRGDAGFSADGQPSDLPVESHSPVRMRGMRPPDHTVDTLVRPEAALLYRLSGDYNPLHSDPDIARIAGFHQPILHGLATFGMSAVAVSRACCGLEPHRLNQVGARFVSPVFPGDTLTTEIWRDGSDVEFQTRVVVRDVLVIANGKAELS